jgi:hypothetical protein
MGLVPDKGDKAVQAANAAALKASDTALDGTYASQKSVNSQYNNVRILLLSANKNAKAAKVAQKNSPKQTTTTLVK